MLTKTKEYETMIVAVYAQKLFHLVFCIVREEKLANRVVEKAFVEAYKLFWEMEKDAFEKHLFQLAAKMAVRCNKTAKKQAGKEPKKDIGFNSLLLTKNQHYAKLASKQTIYFV